MPGTNRKKLIDEKNVLTRVGESGADGNGNITSKSVQTGGAGDGVKRQSRASAFRSAIEREKAESRVFLEDLAGGTGVPSAGRERFSRFIKRRTGGSGTMEDPTDIASQIPRLSKPTRRDLIDTVRPRQERMTVGGVSGTGSTPSGTETRQRLFDKVGGLKPGESIGNFSIGRETAEQENKRRFGTDRKKAGVFTKKGIQELFGSAGELAKLFSSKEFQERKAKGIQSAAGVKGRRADTKAKTDRIKALSGVLEDLSEGDPDLNAPLISRVQEQIQNLIAGGDGGGITPEVVGRLAEKFDDEQIKTILGILK